MTNQAKPIITISGFERAIAKSGVLGFQDMRNLDPFTTPGTLAVNLQLTKVSGAIVTDTIKWLVRNTNGDYYGLGDSGKVYTSSTPTVSSSWSVVAGNTTGSGTPTGQGLKIWKDYLFVFRKSLIDVYGPLSSAPAWSNSWQTMSAGDNDWHPTIIGSDDILYFGDGRYVGSITEASGSTFAPGTGATFTFNAAALTLPAQYRIKCLAQLGRDLMCGTIVGSNSYGGDPGGDIFPWDRTSTSFNRPISVNDAGIHQMVVKNQTLYVVAGLQGSLYRTNGTMVEYIRKLPSNLITTAAPGTFFQFYPGAIMVHKNRVHFGVSAGSSGTPAPAQGLGIYSLGEDGSLNFENQISTDTTTATNNLNISALSSYNSEYYLSAWRDNTTYGIDSIDSNRYAGYKAYFDSEIYEIGVPYNRRTLESCTIILAKPLATSGQGVRIKYRLNPTGSFSTLGTFDFATDGAVYSKTFDASVVGDAQLAQFRVELAETGATPFSLKEVRIE